MKTLPLILRERILASYDRWEGTREEVANRFRVSLGMVKKLLQQRRRTGDIGPRHHFSGRKPLITTAHRRKIGTLLRRKPGMTLKELRAALGLECSLPAIHHILSAMGLTWKERRPLPAAKTTRKSRNSVARRARSKPAVSPSLGLRSKKRK